MPFWRPDPLTSEIDSDGKPSWSSSLRIGSNASCRMNASTFFTRRRLATDRARGHRAAQPAGAQRQPPTAAPRHVDDRRERRGTVLALVADRAERLPEPAT